MAKVVLPFVKYKEAAPLPPVCMRCGKPASRTIETQFKGRVTKFLGIRILAPGGKEDFVIVKTPLCDGHPFEGMGNWYLIIGFLILIPFFVFGVVTKPWIHHYVVVFPIIALIALGTPFVIYVLLTSLSGLGFDTEGVTVGGVSPQFKQAMEDHEWTQQEFEAGLRKNRKGRTQSKQPFWLSLLFIVPVCVMLSCGCCSPVGFLAACLEPSGTWPAGLLRGGRQPNAGEQVANGEPSEQKPAKHPEPFDPKSFEGLVGYWPLDEGQGNAAMDGSGNNLLAFLHGGEWVDGIRGKALRLNGKNDFLDLGPADDHLSFGAGAPFTVACWANTTANDGAISSFRRRGKPFPVVDLLVKDGKVYGWVRDNTSGTGGAKPGGGSIRDGKWHHVALIRQADGTVELYLDGAFQAKEKGASSGGPITTDLHTLGSDRFVVEAKQNLTTNFAGSIDEFCVFSRAMTAEDIALLMGGKK